MTESRATNGRTVSFWRKLTDAWPHFFTERREERRRFIEEKNNLLKELRGATEDLIRATRELQATTDAAVKRVEQAVAKSGATKEGEPSHSELLCIELLKFWKIESNWKKNALQSFEALANDGKGSLAQWGALELLNGGTITLSAKGGSHKRLTQLANDGTVVMERRSDKHPSVEAKTPSPDDGGRRHETPSGDAGVQ